MTRQEKAGEAPQLRRDPEAWRLDCNKLSWESH